MTATEKNNLKSFISNIANKEYSAAQKSLQSVVEDKMKVRINTCLNRKNDSKE